MMLGLGLSIPQLAVRRANSGAAPPATPFFGSTTHHWGDAAPTFGKAS
ncbi:MAG: hypothetical protein M3Y22_14960 [Pseudomonadota bacterium]|nr:hypothetical protein [Sphingomonas sp.]MDQ2764717.1 hypothetical protein [Pseudomonadota bacterium]